MADEKTRIDIGFQGGGMLSTRLAESAIGDFTKALEKGDGWHTLSTEDGDISLRLERVIYLRRESPEQRVGF